MAICGAFLVQFFCSSAKTLRGRKDTLAKYIFIGGAIAPFTLLGSTPLINTQQNPNAGNSI